eukprot:151046_1
MSTKLQLLKFHKKDLIKLCRKYKVNCNGNKNDMIDKLVKNKSFIKNETNSDNNKTSSNRQTIKKMSNSSTSNKKSCFYLFKPCTDTEAKYKQMSNVLNVKEILYLFVDYLPIYTCINFISAFPKYNHYYKTHTINKVKGIQEGISTEEYKKYFNTGLLNNMKKITKLKVNKDNKNILSLMVKNYGKTYDAIKKKKFKYGEKYEGKLGDVEEEELMDEEEMGSLTQWVQFNKTNIYNIDQLLKLFVGIRISDNNINQKKIPLDKIDIYVMKKLIANMDDISWNNMLATKLFEKTSEKFEIISIVYLFLRLMLSFNGDKKIIYSTNWKYEYYPGCLEEAADEHYSGCSFIFKNNGINIYAFEAEEEDLRFVTQFKIVQ